MAYLPFKRVWTQNLGVISIAGLALASCAEGDFDFDLRDNITQGFGTSEAVSRAVAPRPTPDSRGIISYPNYQVAVARRGDTVADVAGRVGLGAEELARFNGIPQNVALRRGEVIALPRRVAEPSPATGAPLTGPIRPAAETAALARPGAVTTQTLEDRATAAIDRSAQPPVPALPPNVQTGQEPVRHKVERGETAFSIARLYDVPVQALAEWNGLDRELTVREGQFLLIPVASEAPQRVAEPSRPGAGTLAPVPPSAATPLPEQDETGEAKEAPPSPQLGQQQTAASSAKFVFPVTGPIIRPFAKGVNDGIDISAPAGTPVKAADSGVVAAITRDTDQIPILVLRHEGNILTVYAGVEDITIKKGDNVARGQTIAKIRNTATPFLHFEVREGFNSVDPVTYLE